MAGGFGAARTGKLTPYQMLLAAGMLTTGCINILVKKYAYDTHSKGLHGNVHAFSKPWTMTWVMFWGEFLCLLYFLVSTGLRRSSRTPPTQSVALLSATDAVAEEFPPLTWRSSFVCFLPAMCDVMGTTLSGIGLLFLPSSIYQLFRGAIILFVGCFSFFVFKRRQYLYQWLGILACVCGLVIVGYAGAHNTQAATSASKAILGTALVVLGMLSSAVQMVVEEKYLKGRNLPPAFVVGAEGGFGIIVMTCIVLPIVAHVPGRDGNGVSENAIDSAVMFGNSSKLQGLVLTYFVSISFYNFCGLSVAKDLSAVHRVLIDAVCSILVWSVDTLVYYVSKHAYGEPWAGEWSIVQIVGFACLLLGSASYYAVIRYKCLTYPDTSAPVLVSDAAQSYALLQEKY